MDKLTIEKYNQLEKIGLSSSSRVFDKMRGKTDPVHFCAIAFLALIEKNNWKIEDVVKDETVRKYLISAKDKTNKSVVSNLAESLSLNELEAFILTYDQDVRERRFWELPAPKSLIQLSFRLLNIEEGDRVLDMSSGVGDFLLLANVYQPEAEYSGIEINATLYSIAKIRAFVANQDINYKLGNHYAEHDHQYNRIMQYSTLGTKFRIVESQITSKEVKKIIKDIGRIYSAEWADILTLLNLLEENGKGLSIVSNNTLSVLGDQNTRKYVLENQFIEGVISLPENLLATSSMPVSILVFSEGNTSVRMVDASNLFTKGMRQNRLSEKDIEEIINLYKDDSSLVSLGDIAADDYILTPKRYLGQEYNEGSSLTLDDAIKNISRGSTIQRTELEKITSKKKTNIQFLRIQDIDDRGHINSELSYIKEIPEGNEKHVLQEGDLVISKLIPFKCAIIPDDIEEKILPTGNLYRIQINTDKFNPYFLAMYLNSYQGRDQMNRLAGGSFIRSISIKDLRRLSLPEISKEKQDELVRQYLDMDNQISLLEQQKEVLEERQSAIIEEVF